MQLQILLFLPGAIWPHHPESPAKKKSVQSYTLFSELRYLSFELKWAVACFCFLTNIDCLPWCTSRSIRHDIRPARLFHPKFCLSISWRWHHLQLCPLGCGSVACQRLECFQQTSNPNNLFFYFTNILFMYIYVYIGIFYWCSPGNKSQWTRIFWDFDAFAYILLQLPPDVCAVDGARELLNHLSD